MVYVLPALLILISLTLFVSISCLASMGTISKRIHDLYVAALGEVTSLQDALREEQIKARDQIERAIEMRVQNGHLLAKVVTMQEGRAADQEMLNSTIERAERFKRVLEAVLRSQGCDDDRVAFVMSRTEQDLDLEIE